MKEVNHERVKSKEVNHEKYSLSSLLSSLSFIFGVGNDRESFISF